MHTEVFSEPKIRNCHNTLSDQKHLNYQERVNLGSYYTPKYCVEKVQELIAPFIQRNTVILDSSCGYGAFLENPLSSRIIGNDIDAKAIARAESLHPHIELYQHNSLVDINRKRFNINDDDDLIIVGNPPYNDKTSIIRSNIKKQLFEIDPEVNSRDLGNSFLLSYNLLKANYVCVLHPLSYLIKRTNFLSLGKFAKNYKLINGIVVSSHAFSESSKAMAFPIVIALYERNSAGMSFQYVSDFLFKVDNGASFRMNDYEFIGNFVNKYPSKIKSTNSNNVYFWTMRDINALKRNRTFLSEYCENAIVVDKKSLLYYVYVDVIKDFSYIIPYYFGNFDIIINTDYFNQFYEYFISYACRKYDFCSTHFVNHRLIDNDKEKIIEYFRLLLGVHYVKH
jgi:hypothetical protein